MTFPISCVDIRLSVHATEDFQKVEAAVHNIIPASIVELPPFKKNPLKGHYGNPITLLETRIERQEPATALVKNLFERLSKSDKEIILLEPELFLDANSLYLRLDKQAAFKSAIRLQTADPICLRIRFKARGKKGILPICRELGLKP